MGCTEAMDNGSLCELCLSFCYHGSGPGKGDTEGGRMIYQVVNGRALGEFIVLYALLVLPLSR